MASNKAQHGFTFDDQPDLTVSHMSEPNESEKTELKCAICLIIQHYILLKWILSRVACHL